MDCKRKEMFLLPQVCTILGAQWCHSTLIELALLYPLRISTTNLVGNRSSLAECTIDMCQSIQSKNRLSWSTTENMSNHTANFKFNERNSMSSCKQYLCYKSLASLSWSAQSCSNSYSASFALFSFGWRSTCFSRSVLFLPQIRDHRSRHRLHQGPRTEPSFDL